MAPTLGSTVRDAVSGVQGVALSYVVHKNSCVRVCIQPPIHPEGKGKVPESEWIDGPDIELVGEAVYQEDPLMTIPLRQEKPGGSNDTPPAYATP